MMRNLKISGALFCFGALYGSLGDYAHVLSQTTFYLVDDFRLFDHLPWWVPILFGMASLAVGWGHLWTDAFLGLSQLKRPGTTSVRWVLFGCWAFLANYILSCVVGRTLAGSTSDLILAIIPLCLWWTLDRTGWGVAQAVVTAFLGSWAEMNLIQDGVFLYAPHLSNWNGVPSWLPWLYIAAAFAGANLARWLSRTAFPKAQPLQKPVL